MSETVSESTFERICDRRGVPYRKLATRENQRTPDYLILPSGEKVVVEVKQIEPNDEDRELQKKSKEGETTGWWSDNDARIRRKIKQGAKQLKTVAKGRCPSVLMLYDDREIKIIDNEDFLEAMYGDEELTLAVPLNGGKPKPLGVGFGGNRQLTEQQRLYISAVAIMRQKFPGEWIVAVFHNVFASRPLDPDVASSFADVQYALTEPKTKEYQDWTRVR